MFYPEILCDLRLLSPSRGVGAASPLFQSFTDQHQNIVVTSALCKVGATYSLPVYPKNVDQFRLLTATTSQALTSRDKVHSSAMDDNIASIMQVCDLSRDDAKIMLEVCLSSSKWNDIECGLIWPGRPTITTHTGR